MRATGIVQRVDNLGRVVIPKEIRRQCRIHEGEPLEIYVDHYGDIPVVCFAKYSSSFGEELQTVKEKVLELMNDVGEYEDAEDFRKAMAEAEKVFKKFEGKG